MELIEERNIIGVGTSKAVTLPSDWVNHYHLRLGQVLLVETKNDTIIIRIKKN